MYSAIAGIEYCLPEGTVSTEELSRSFPNGNVGEVARKTGIQTRHISAENQYASDLGVSAATKLFQSGVCSPADIDFLLFCTQSPDYILPTTACLVQERLGLSVECGALDFNLGCSGFVYGLGLAHGLIASGQANKVLLITADTYSKYLNLEDKNSRVIFGDGAAATLVVSTNREHSLGPFCYATDGRGANSIIVPNSGTRIGCVDKIPQMNACVNPGQQPPKHLFMDGARVFKFAVERVPEMTTSLLKRAGLSLSDIKLFVFHQANAYMLKEIGRAMQVSLDRLQITLNDCGNTVSSTIPIALKHAEQEGKLEDADKVMLVGFGVGFSMAATIARWTGSYRD